VAVLQQRKVMFVMARLLLVILLAGVLFYWLQPDNTATTSAADNSLPIIETMGGDFIMPSTLGRDIDLAELRGKVLIVNFGYTSCPDICPAALSRISRVMDELSNQGSTLQQPSVQSLKDQLSKVQPLFVTLDPERDSLEKLTSYLHYFNPTFIGLRGSDEQTALAANLYKVFYEKEQMDSVMGYSIAHTDYIYLLDQQGQLRGSYGHETSPTKIAQDVQSLLEP
jgi:protein SCO1/2